MDVNVKRTVPFEIPVIKPLFVMAAIVAFWLAHVPPVPGLTCVVKPWQISVGPVTETVGFGNMVNVVVGFETQLVLDSVKTNCVLPGLIPVTTPALLMVTTDGLVAVQVPPLAGSRVVVPPTQICAELTETLGLAFTVIKAEGRETQPVDVLVKTKFVIPAETPVIIPPFVTVATDVLADVHVPPVLGVRELVLPIQIAAGPVI